MLSLGGVSFRPTTLSKENEDDMIRILFIPTGNTFVLPDEEALKIKQQDRANEYQILDAGIMEEQETKQVSKEDVAELVKKAEERKEEIEQEDAEVEAKEEAIAKAPDKETLNLRNFTKPELIGWMRKFGIKANHNDSKATMIQKCIDAGINV